MRLLRSHPSLVWLQYVQKSQQNTVRPSLSFSVLPRFYCSTYCEARKPASARVLAKSPLARPLTSQSALAREGPNRCNPPCLGYPSIAFPCCAPAVFIEHQDLSQSPQVTVPAQTIRTSHHFVIAVSNPMPKANAPTKMEET